MTTMRTGFITAERTTRPARRRGPEATVVQPAAPTAERSSGATGSLQALALAVAGSVIVTGLMWTAL